MNEHLCLNTRILLTPLRAGLRAGGDNHVDVLVRIQAPDTPVGALPPRPPYGLALVVDRSGSMSGRPIAQARRCAEFVIDHLGPQDTVSVIQFDSQVDLLHPASARGDGIAAKLAIQSLEPGGSTDLHGGWLAGAQSLGDSAGVTALRRVILLSDGCANHGLIDAAAIAEQCREWAARGITTSTYGLGSNFNEALMVAMARAGEGNQYYGETADDLMDPFQQEFSLLANLCLRQLTLGAAPVDAIAGGIEVALANDYPRQTDGRWRLPDLGWGAEAWGLLRVFVPEASLPRAGFRLPLLRIEVTAQDLQGQPVALEKASLALMVLSPAAYDALPAHELVARRLSELEAAALLQRMRDAAMAHDWAAVDAQLLSAESLFAGNEWVASILRAMRVLADSRSRERIMKEALYSSSKLSSRLSAKDEGVQFSVMEEAERPAFLRRKPAEGKAGPTE